MLSKFATASAANLCCILLLLFFALFSYSLFQELIVSINVSIDKKKYVIFFSLIRKKFFCYPFCSAMFSLRAPELSTLLLFVCKLNEPPKKKS